MVIFTHNAPADLPPSFGGRGRAGGYAINFYFFIIFSWVLATNDL